MSMSIRMKNFFFIGMYECQSWRIPSCLTFRGYVIPMPYHVTEGQDEPRKQSGWQVLLLSPYVRGLQEDPGQDLQPHAPQRFAGSCAANTTAMADLDDRFAFRTKGNAQDFEANVYHGAVIVSFRSGSQTVTVDLEKRM
jgi:hypothetical protein